MNCIAYFTSDHNYYMSVIEYLNIFKVKSYDIMKYCSKQIKIYNYTLSLSSITG